MLLVVAQRSDGEHDADKKEYYTARTFHYELESIRAEAGPEPVPEAGPWKDGGAPVDGGGEAEAGASLSDEASLAGGACGCRAGRERREGAAGILGAALLGWVGLRRARAARRRG